MFIRCRFKMNCDINLLRFFLFLLLLLSSFTKKMKIASLVEENRLLRVLSFLSSTTSSPRKANVFVVYSIWAKKDACEKSVQIKSFQKKAWNDFTLHQTPDHSGLYFIVSDLYTREATHGMN